MSTTTDAPAAAPSPAKRALADLDQELATTRRVLERVPEARFGWKPHEKSFSLGELATHVATLSGWGSSILTSDEMDLGAPVPRATVPATAAELLERFDGAVAAFREALGRADDDALGRPWTLRKGEHVIFTLPKSAVLRSSVISHIVHHRGQLTVYLRLLDVPLPSVYGPTADEAGGF